MGSFAPKGHARLDPQRPSAFAICDCCGFLYNHRDLRWNTQWHGRQLRKTGFLRCSTCIDQPNPGLIPIVLPPDPVPILNPRSEPVHCHVFKPRADVVKFPHTADVSNTMFPPIDMWKDVTADKGSVCDTRTNLEWPIPGPGPWPPPEPVPVPDDIFTADETSTSVDITMITADHGYPVDPLINTYLFAADTTVLEADNETKKAGVMPDYLYAADITTTESDTTTVDADNQT